MILDHFNGTLRTKNKKRRRHSTFGLHSNSSVSKVNFAYANQPRARGKGSGWEASRLLCINWQNYFSELKTWVHILFDICVLYSGRTLWKFWLNFSGFYLNIVPDAIRMRFANVLVLSFILALIANSAGNECDKADKECISEHEKSKYSKGKSNYRKLFWCGTQSQTTKKICIYVCDKQINFFIPYIP